MRKIAEVLLPLPFNEAFTYSVPCGLELEAGDIVLVPFQSREKTGVVWSVQEEPQPSPKKFRVKEITSVMKGYHIPRVSRQFVDWMADYTLNSRGQILKMVISSREAFLNDPSRTGYCLAPGHHIEGILFEDKLQSPQPISEIMRQTGKSRHQVQKWIRDGKLIPAEIAGHLILTPDPEHHQDDFSPSQQAAVNKIKDQLASQEFSVTLIEGVTGSGKTNVYLEGVADALARKKQILILLPEIALSPQVINRFTRRFGVEPAVWHSEISLNQRKKNWRGICAGEIQVVIGARSALFLPFARLGLIIVDEEHEQSYKQEEGVIYQARDMAVVRAKLGQIPVLLVSATPSLETVVNCEQHRYERVFLPERFGVLHMPALTLVDCRLPQNTAAGLKWLTAPLVDKIEDTLKNGNQTLLFLNRRGYAPLTLCRHCGHRIQCVQCSAWLVEHRYFSELRCHQCGYTVCKPETCPQCQSPDQLVSCGPGVERLSEEVAARFPEARTLIMASDMIQGPRHLRECLDKIVARQVDLVIGTQMMAKGHHFENLTLVGVIDADLGLNGGDLRACEKTYQLLHQVAGRAGRVSNTGQVLIQTYQPEHPVMQALVSMDQERFIEEESSMRMQGDMPPYTRLTALIISSPSAEDAEQSARLMARNAPPSREIDIMGPVPAPVSMIRGRHRWRLLLRTPKNISPQSYLRHWLGTVSLKPSVRLQIDIDPYSFL